MEVMLAQYLLDSKQECAIYYLRKKMATYKESYNLIEKTCIALVWTCEKLRYYMVAFEVWLKARMNLCKYIMKRIVLTRNTLRWITIIVEFDIKYVTQSLLKVKVIVEYLVAYPTSIIENLNVNFLKIGNGSRMKDGSYTLIGQLIKMNLE